MVDRLRHFLMDDKSREILEREHAAHEAELEAARRAQSRTTPEIQVWIEGYQTNGERDTARLMGSVVATDFDNAVLRIMAEQDTAASRRSFHRHPDGTWTYWGCRLFDNEAEARQSFG